MNQLNGLASQFHIRGDRTLTHPQVQSLPSEHLAGMRTAPPPEYVFALDLGGLRLPEITVLPAPRRRTEGAPHAESEQVAVGALKELTPATVPSAATANSNPCA